jgi:hypothetical protein
MRAAEHSGVHQGLEALTPDEATGSSKEKAMGSDLYYLPVKTT